MCSAMPKYLVVKQKDGDFAKVSLFLIEKSITGCAESVVQDISKDTGGLLVETLIDQHGSRRLKLQTIGDTDVEVLPDTTLNTIKRVVVCRHLLNCTEGTTASVSYTHLINNAYR